MTSRVKILMENKLIRYVLVGGTSYLIELGVLYTLVGVGLSQIAAVATSFWCGLAISFILQKIFAFSNRERTTKKLVWQSASYGILVGVNYFFTLVMVALGSPHIGLLLARTTALLITTGWNYFIYSRFIFKKNN